MFYGWHNNEMNYIEERKAEIDNMIRLAYNPYKDISVIMFEDEYNRSVMRHNIPMSIMSQAYAHCFNEAMEYLDKKEDIIAYIQNKILNICDTVISCEKRMTL